MGCGESGALRMAFLKVCRVEGKYEVLGALVKITLCRNVVVVSGCYLWDKKAVGVVMTWLLSDFINEAFVVMFQVHSFILNKRFFCVLTVLSI